MEITKNQKTLIGGIALVVLIALVFLLDRTNIRNEAREVTLSIEPQSGTVKTGEVFKVDIILDTTKSPIDGVDIYVLHFDPTILQVVDDLTEQAGIQIQPGTILPVAAGNIADQTAGIIKFSMVSNPGTNFTGKGILASIHFKAIKVGVSDLKFDFTAGSTVDTNAAFSGQDQLRQVLNASYSIEP